MCIYVCDVINNLFVQFAFFCTSLYFQQSSIIQDTVGTSYSIDLCLRDLITKSWHEMSHSRHTQSVARVVNCYPH